MSFQIVFYVYKNTRIHVHRYTLELLYRKIYINSVRGSFMKQRCGYFQESASRDPLLSFHPLCTPHCLFYLSLHCQAIRVFIMFTTSSATASPHIYIYVHLHSKCFCRVDSQKGECRILVCDLQAFSILFHASQLSLLISAEPPFESNLANLHSRGKK